MKLNNKGVTIIELIVSIALISVVMLFMYRLLADVTFQKDNDYFASVNQEQRIEIIDNMRIFLVLCFKIMLAFKKIIFIYFNMICLGIYIFEIF